MKSIETRMILTPDQDEVPSALERVIGCSSFAARKGYVDFSVLSPSGHSRAAAMS